MLEKEINKLIFDHYGSAVEDAFEDVLHHPNSEYREKELSLLVDLVYRSGFKDGLQLSSWLNNE